MTPATSASQSFGSLTLACDVEVKGHEVVHLPVAHCELNPIKLAWAYVKVYNDTCSCDTYIREHVRDMEDNTGSKMD